MTETTDTKTKPKGELDLYGVAKAMTERTGTVHLPDPGSGEAKRPSMCAVSTSGKYTPVVGPQRTSADLVRACELWLAGWDASAAAAETAAARASDARARAPKATG